jgi:hypothetical protein
VRIALVAALAGVVLAVPSSARAAPYAPIPTCSPGPADCTAWHTGDVSISWQFEPGWTDIQCSALPVTADGVTPRTCRVWYGPDNEFARTINVRRDATPPQVTGSTPSRAPDSGGWYSRPVAVSFAGTDATSGIAACTSPTYGGGDGASVSVSGTCTDVAGNTSAPATFALRYDATPPTVAARPDRAPDGKGWYRRPVTVSFDGADATSGVAACSEARRYAGPDGPSVELAGTCRDAAGNVAAELRVQLRYDATAPAVARARARIERGAARLTWQRPADAAAIEVERTPGVDGRRSTVVYQGRGESFVDRTVRAGAVYRYEIRAIDAAGNVGSLAVSTGAAQPLHRPAAGATVRAPVVLAWTAARGARFYNVQLYRGGRKILSTWPKRPTLRLPRAWAYAGRTHRLGPGLYRWYVWPARGTLERPVYGKVLGSSTFRVAR